MTAVFPSAYFPSIGYLKTYFSHKDRCIEVYESFPKQTYRNRCDISTSMGKLRLSIPLKKPQGSKTMTKDILLDGSAMWQKEHWRSIRTAYAAAPYFEQYDKEIHQLIHTKHNHLIDLNFEILEFIHEVVDRPFDRQETDRYNTDGIMDLRNETFDAQETPPYFQVFSEENGFIPHLSILDLLFNEGPFIRNWILS
tara:strand:- start:491 stop:1078 length:588 start_codon:yes stop_codon:yes gene_type:complete